MVFGKDQKMEGNKFNFGKKRTLSQRQKISERVKLEYLYNPERKIKISETMKKKAWNKGIKMSEEQRQKLKVKHRVTDLWREKNKSRNWINPMVYAENREKISIKAKLRYKEYPESFKLTEETKRKLKGRVPWNRGKEFIQIKGKNHPNWQGGKSFEPYGIEFNNKLKEFIRKRDNYRCQECFRHQDELFTKSGRRYKLNIHHIDYNKQNNNSDNLISLCRNCHTQTNFNRNDWIEYYNKKLNEVET